MNSRMLCLLCAAVLATPAVAGSAAPSSLRPPVAGLENSMNRKPEAQLVLDAGEQYERRYAHFYIWYNNDGQRELVYDLVEWQNSPDGYPAGSWYRQLHCAFLEGAVGSPRFDKAILVSNRSAEMAPAFLDTASANCWTEGYRFLDDTTYEPYPYTGIVALSGIWKSPDTIEDSSSVVRTTIASTGEMSLRHCKDSLGLNVREGGYSINGVYRPFILPTSPDAPAAVGSFGSTDCDDNVR